MTKKHMDGRLRVFSCECDTQKQQKLHYYLLHFLLQNTYFFVK